MNFFKKYRWIFMILIFVATLTFSIILFVNPDNFGNKMACFVTGVAVLAFGVIRFYPLIKSLDDKKAVVANTVEIFIDLIIGALLVAFSFNSDLSAYMWMYKYLTAAVLYIRGIVYLAETGFFKTKAEVSKFIASVIFISIGAAMVVSKDFDENWLRYIFASLCTILALYSIIDGYINYSTYRKTYAKPKPVKAIEVEKQEKNEQVVDVDNQNKTIDNKEVNNIEHNNIKPSSPVLNSEVEEIKEESKENK